MQKEIYCPIWGSGNKATLWGDWVEAKIDQLSITSESFIESPRAGGAFKLGKSVPSTIVALNALSIDDKARLTTWLVDQRRRGNRAPVITRNIAHSFSLPDNRNSLSVSKRGERLLLFLVDQTKNAGGRS